MRVFCGFSVCFVIIVSVSGSFYVANCLFDTFDYGCVILVLKIELKQPGYIAESNMDLNVTDLPNLNGNNANNSNVTDQVSEIVNESYQMISTGGTGGAVDDGIDGTGGTGGTGGVGGTGGIGSVSEVRSGGDTRDTHGTSDPNHISTNIGSTSQSTLDNSSNATVTSLLIHLIIFMCIFQ